LKKPVYYILKLVLFYYIHDFFLGFRFELLNNMRPYPPAIAGIKEISSSC